jgi:hypothetical protein
VPARLIASCGQWPYSVKKFTTKPKPPVYKDAIQFDALAYQRVEVNVSALKQAIAAGHTPIIGLTVYESFEGDAVAKNRNRSDAGQA